MVTYQPVGIPATDVESVNGTFCREDPWISN
jgi:hypothetical protein